MEGNRTSAGDFKLTLLQADIFVINLFVISEVYCKSLMSIPHKKELQIREFILDKKSGKLAYLTKIYNNVIPFFSKVKVTNDGNVAVSDT